MDTSCACVAVYCSMLQCTSPQPQHTATHCNTLQHERTDVWAWIPVARSNNRNSPALTGILIALARFLRPVWDVSLFEAMSATQPIAAEWQRLAQDVHLIYTFITENESLLKPSSGAESDAMLVCVRESVQICKEVYEYMCTYVHTGVYVCIHIYIYICVYVNVMPSLTLCSSECASLCRYAKRYRYMYVYMCVCVCVYIDMYVYICTYIYFEMCIYVYMYICIYVYISVCKCAYIYKMHTSFYVQIYIHKYIHMYV